MRPPSFYQGFHITYSLLKPSTSIAFLSMRRVVDWGVADLTWCSFCAECLLCARFTSERGSWVDWHRGRWGAAEGAGVRAAVINPQSKRSWLVPRHRRPDGRGLVGLDGCEARLCDPCARVSRVCPGSPRCLFTSLFTGTTTKPVRCRHEAKYTRVAVGPFSAPFIAHCFADTSPSPCQPCILTTHRARHLAKFAIGVQSAQARCGRLF